ncbi:CBS domain-containing protein [Prauserella flavalba]|uniref:Signal transduction protein n=1 Tax=Prauserella flavalba TaxID=1477506 RepID=A0A318LVY3_9PSEU|nr:CBS domain-containing protein [Prauserella flavalba]PXY36518.1 signal transduction protein [Prauserella flavalba]
MHARDIMSRPVVTVSPDTSILDAIALLLRHGFAALPVVDEDDRVIGIFTEADALRGEASAQGRADLTVASSMTRPVEVVTADTDLVRIGRKMLADSLRCVPVVHEGVLIGVVSRRDLLRPLVRQDDAIAAQLRGVLADYDGHRNRWSVEVVGGIATIRGDFADAAERQMLDALAKSVPGVVRTQLAPRHAEV